jgi:hypothetical protein
MGLVTNLKLIKMKDVHSIVLLRAHHRRLDLKLPLQNTKKTQMHKGTTTNRGHGRQLWKGGKNQQYLKFDNF